MASLLLGKTEKDTTEGGVFLLVKDCFVASKQKQFKTICEIIWVKLNIASAKTLFVAAYYRRKEGDAEGAEELQRSIEMVSKTKGNVWILGDFNYPNFTWDADHVPSIKPGCSYTNLYDDFMTRLDDFSFVQMVTEPTRQENFIDLFLTTNHTQFQKTEILPSIADHDIIVADVNVTPQVGRQKPRNVPLYRKAD